MCNISQNIATDCQTVLATELRVHTLFTLTYNTETHRFLLLGKYVHQLLLDLLMTHVLDDAGYHLLQ